MDETLRDEIYWVGSMNGQLVVYDPEIQLNDSKHVILFFRMHEKYVPYIKAQARGNIKKISAEHKEYHPTISHYKSWLETNKDQKIYKGQTEARERDKNYSTRICLLKKKHRKHVEDSGKKYMGVSETSTQKDVRTTLCYSCHSIISNDINLECNICRWIICPKCGVCKCGYES